MLPFFPSAVIFSADGSASMPLRSASQKWKVISSICGHSTLRGSLVTVQKNFIYFQVCSCLSEPPGVEWRRGGWGGLHSLSTAGSWQPPALLFLGIPEVFWSAFWPSGSWTFTATVCLLYIGFLFFPDLAVSYMKCVYLLASQVCHFFLKWIKIFFNSDCWWLLFPQFFIIFLFNPSRFSFLYQGLPSSHWHSAV